MPQIEVYLGSKALELGLTSSDIMVDVSPVGLSMLAKAKVIKAKSDYAKCLEPTLVLTDKQPEKSIIEELKNRIAEKVEPGVEQVELTDADIQVIIEAGKARAAEIEAELERKRQLKEAEREEEKKRKRIAEEVLGDTLKSLKRELEFKEMKIKQLAVERDELMERNQVLIEFLREGDEVEDFVDWLLTRKAESEKEAIIEEFGFNE